MAVTLPVSAVSHLIDRIYQVLVAQDGPMREYDLMAKLGEEGIDQFSDQTYRDNLSLYQSHFLLFHCLYRLRDRLRHSKNAELEIHCLAIKLHPYTRPDLIQQQLQRDDPLREFYLDLNNLENTSADDVEALLYGFWQRFSANDQRKQALEVLGLQDPVEHCEIKDQYRKLVMEHHPDRGGDVEMLQAINVAMRVLQDNSR